MAKFSGATVLLILIATVSVYTCAIIAGAALGRTLDRPTTTRLTPSDRALRVSVSFRGLAEDFAKELWAGNHREARRSGRPLAGAGDGAEVVLSSSHATVDSRASSVDYESALQPITTERNTTHDHTRAASTASPWSSRHSNYSDEITEERRPGGREVTKFGPWGGSGGQAFYMRRGRGGRAPRVRSVALHYTDAIHSFRQSSRDTVVLKRTQEPFGGGSVPIHTTTYEQINFASNEQLIAVEGTYGHCSYVSQVVVTSLTFRTDKGTTYGPYGKETGTPFSMKAGTNGCIIGFWGRSGWLLDAIGVYIRSCQAHKAVS